VQLSGDKIAAWFADWAGRRMLEEDIFGTGDPERIAAIVDRFCVRSLGSPIERYEFFSSSVLSVHGVCLRDGRRVVIKAARRSFGAAFLGATQTVQCHLAASGFPCPSPLLEPAALNSGVCVVENLLDRGTRADAHEPRVRREMAYMLARQIEVSRRFVPLEGLGPSLLASPRAGELWPEPHDMRFDFAASARGAEWIDELATAARERLAVAVGDIVVGHSDWRAEHVRFERHKIVATYDWQSLAVGSEPALLGQIGHGFTADWKIDQTRRTPTIQEFRAFITDYDTARGQHFSAAERKTIDAAWVYATAYGARCEHSDLALGMPGATADPSDDSYRSLLARHGRELLE
jgi:hypothetical protein